MSKEAMKLSLEALKKVSRRAVIMGSTGDYRSGQKDALDAVSEDVAPAIKLLEEALAKQEQGEPSFSFQMQLKQGWGSQYPTAQVIGQPDLESLFRKIGDVITFYTTPQQQQRKPLTTLERLDLHMAFEPHKLKWNAQSILIDMVEAAHGIKE